MSGHTKEPWRLEPGANSYFFDLRVLDADGKCIAFVEADELEQDEEGEYHFLPSAQAARLISCVNACAAIPDPVAFVEAARGMVPLLEQAFDEAILDADLADAIEAALAAFRAQIGEA